MAPGDMLVRLPAWPFSTRIAASGPAVIERIQRLGRLETCRVNESVVIHGQTGGVLPTWLAGDRLTFLGRGEVVAGIDLSRLSAANVQVRGAAATVYLPPSEVFYTGLDNRTSEVCARQSGFFSGPDRELETRVRQEAEDRLRQAALDTGILATATDHARDAIRRELTLLGFREVRFV